MVVPAGWLNAKGVSGQVFGGLARLVYGAQIAESASSEAVVRRLSHSGWVDQLGTRMTEAGFDVSVRIASNRKGAALVLIGQLANPDQE